MTSFRNVITAIMGGLLLASCQQRIPAPDFDIRNVNADAQALETKSVNITQTLDPKLLRPSERPYLLGPGDIVEIEIAELGGTLSRTFIMPDGMVYYNLAGGVHAEGLTTAQLAQKLAQALKRDYANPVVNVSLVEVRSNRYWILGRVFKPGLYPLGKPTTLLEAVSNAGGLFTSAFSGTTEELADLSKSMIIRNGEIIPVNFSKLIREGDTSQNVYLQHNDYIYIPSTTSASVLLLGEVMQPQSIGHKEGLTLIDCIAQGKGPAPGAYIKQVVIVRGSLGEAKAAIVDLKAILTGKESNVVLEPGDIVWIPKRPFKGVESMVSLIFKTAIRTVAANEGSSYSGGERQPLSIPVTPPAAP